MAKRTRNIPYHLLRGGDRIDCDVRGIFPVTTRIVTCGGLGHLFDYSRATHTAMVYEAHGQFFCLEMQLRGIRMISLEEYVNKWDFRIIQFARSRAYDTWEARESLMWDASLLIRRGIEYDIKGVLSFVGKRIKDNGERHYCSEMYYVLTRDWLEKAGYPYPDSFEKRVSPWDLQKWTVGWDIVHKY
jgi:hypothetical protein